MTPEATIEKRLYALMARSGYQPLKHHELAAALHVKTRERPALRALLRQGATEGRLVCLRKNRWALPAAGRSITARISALPNGGAIATSTTQPPQEFFIGRLALAGALHGDVVALELFRRRRRADSTERAEARVVRVLERPQRRIAGVLVRDRFYWQVIPEHPKIHDAIRVSADETDIGLIEHHYVVVELDSWKGPDERLRGVVIEDLGTADRPGLIAELLLRNRQLSKAFADDVVAAARARAPELSESDLQGREDCRGLLSFTIDPTDARDFDDAVSLIPQAEGWEVGVHIADVSHFVPVGSPIDREASRRGNSVYLIGDFIPMLPQHLTSDVCSLRPQVDRLTYTVWISLAPDGRMLRSRLSPAVIRSSARLNYDEVQAHFDHPERSTVPGELHAALQAMRELAHLLRSRRFKAGALDLAMPEVKCELDRAGEVLSIQKRGAPEAYQLIEEFMLLANVAVAERMASRRIPSLYRIHEEPEEDQWAAMTDALRLFGIHHVMRSEKDINEVCSRVAGTPLAYTANLAILRNLRRAIYSDRLAPHFGLGFRRYTHFTSPIRRYPDLLVHRLLKACDAKQRMPYSHEDMRRLANHCSETERNAAEAEEESLRLKCIEFYAARLAQKEVGPYPALITGVSARGLLVELTDTLQRGLVPIYTLGDDHFEANPEQGVVRGRYTRRQYRVGQVVNALLARVDRTRRQVDFVLADKKSASEPPISESGKSTSAPPRRARRQKRGR